MKVLILSIVLTFYFAVFVNAQVPAFPGAEGGGIYATGGRGGRVIFVDNLNNKGDGSLRKAIEAEGPRIVVFRVSGNIELKKTLHIKNNDLTIAGQTAPGEGICLTNYGIRIDADNVIIRYIRVRPGDKADEENDAISAIRNKNIIIDHCSLSWASDEVASFYDNENFTLQWSIISESLYKSVHHKGTHGYGGIWGGWNASFHYNLLSDHTSRNPRLCGSRYSGKAEQEKTDVRNNVIYNWGFNTIYGGEEGSYNIVNNYFKHGPATDNSKRSRILELTQQFYNKNINPDTLGAGWFYIHGNVMEGSPEVTSDNWKYGVEGSDVDEIAKAKSRLDKPVECTAVSTTDAKTAYHDVLHSAGASLQRDAVDLRIIDEVSTGREQYGKSYKGGENGIIDSQNEVGGWPVLKQKKPPVDSDNDGIPDKWEKKNKLNPADPSDNQKYSLDKDYTNIEVYINSLAD
ncbi:MAG: pectate lyase family protein [Bacteroidota bacterium]